MSSKKNKLDLHLREVYNQYIALKDNDYKKAQEVFKGVFTQVKSKMEEQCNYFGQYSSEVMYAGSVYDGIKVSKLDEFDMDIVIRLPINYTDGIIIENDQPGFVKMKIGEAFDLLDKQQNWEKCHKVTRDWRDSEKYLLQNKFRHWMHAIVQKAMDEMNRQVTVNNVVYLLSYKESGPAQTINIQNSVGDETFNLDVDLVPVIRFQVPIWPEGYRTVNDTTVKNWLVVPKPNKSLQDGKLKNRCWRLSFQEFERDMMKDKEQFKPCIRLLKKLRDSRNMSAIASYYIKTLFLWKLEENNDKKFWQRPISQVFQMMVQELYDALTAGVIPYFWQKDNNLIGGLKPTLQKLYCEQLKDVLNCIEAGYVDKLKKLRDSRNMPAIASYYIKTLFLWKLEENNDKKFWQRPISQVFQMMVQELYDALTAGVIPYFWQKDNNLIGGLRPTLQKLYCERLKDVLDNIEAGEVDKVVGALLNTDELQEFKSSDFYKKQTALATPSPNVLTSSNNPLDLPKTPKKSKTTDQVDGKNTDEDKAAITRNLGEITKKIDRQNAMLIKIENRLDLMLDIFEKQNERLQLLEMERKQAADASGGAKALGKEKYVTGEMLINITTDEL